MDTWLLAVDCVINLGILGWLVYEYRNPAPLILTIEDKHEDPPA